MPTPIQTAQAAVATSTERLGRHSVSPQVMQAIRTAAGATGVGFEVLAAKAAVESGFQPAAQARTSSARGLFQFIEQTWLDMVQRRGAEHGLAEEAAAISRGAGGRLTVADPAERSRILDLRNNPELSARMAAEYLRDVAETLSPVLGRQPDAAELYMGHFLGPVGARQILQGIARDPAQAASAILPDAAAANRSMFHDASGRPLSAAEFMGNIRTRLGRAYAEIGLSAPDGPLPLQPRAVASREGEAVSLPGVASSSAPARIALGPEQAMLSALARVFTRMGRGSGEVQKAEGGAVGLPAAVLAALREDARPAGGRIP